jgi:hypothetical protein
MKQRFSNFYFEKLRGFKSMFLPESGAGQKFLFWPQLTQNVVAPPAPAPQLSATLCRYIT